MAVSTPGDDALPLQFDPIEAAPGEPDAGRQPTSARRRRTRSGAPIAGTATRPGVSRPDVPGLLSQDLPGSVRPDVPGLLLQDLPGSVRPDVPDSDLPDGDLPVLTVGQVLARVGDAVAAIFPARTRVWVRGEIHRITVSQRGHCYVDLVDPALGPDAASLKVSCWRSVWGPLRALLADQGVELQAGMVATFGGRVELYAPRAQVTFIADVLDVDALVGRLAAQRAALVRRLEAEGLLDRARSLAISPVPLRVGLVASPGTEGFRDFVGQLTESGFAFDILVAPVAVQGAAAPPALVAGIRSFVGRDLDVVAVVRGGGSKADLAAFDDEQVARAVAALDVPVWTGIGHSGDQSVADLVAHTAWRTPTACGQALVDRVSTFWEHVRQAAGRLAGSAVAITRAESERHFDQRRRLGAATTGQVARRQGSLDHQRARVAAGARHAVAGSRAQLAGRVEHLAPVIGSALAREQDRVVAWRRLLAAYDVERQLRRGYSITTDGAGRVVRDVASARRAGTIITRLADGTVCSTVDQPAGGWPDGEDRAGRRVVAQQPEDGTTRPSETEASQ